MNLCCKVNDLIAILCKEIGKSSFLTIKFSNHFTFFFIWHNYCNLTGQKKT